MRSMLGIAVVVAGMAVAPGAAAQVASENAGPAEGGESSRLREAARLRQSLVLGGGTLSVPARHVVQSGDTLWDICAAKLRNPWLWPEVWSLNPEITNPHWIYPGQIVRLRSGDSAVMPYGWGEPQALGRITGGTVFFRSEGFVEKDVEEPPGTIVASWEDEMMLAYPDMLYVRFRQDFPVQAGQEYTIYRLRETVNDMVEDEEGDPVELGRIVEILGTGRVESFDSEARLARVRLTESINPIERGDAVGPIQRNFIVSQPRAAEVDLDGQIVALLRPRVLNGAGFVAFVNRGYDAGVRDGNSFTVIRAADHYLLSNDEELPPDLPFEWIGECRVLEARSAASTCLITSSTREMAIGERVTLIAGQ